MSADRKVQITAWVLTAALASITIAHWATIRLGDGKLGPYELFPLLGLLAFTLMWLHYTINPIKIWLGATDTALKNYYKITGILVLVLILLHPGIFVTNLWLDGLGLPPNSYLVIYPEVTQTIALILGTISLVAFLAFELHRKFRQKTWWRWVEYANIAAMFAIFFHALTLGGEISGWFGVLWFAYAILLAASIAYNYYYKHKRERPNA